MPLTNEEYLRRLLDDPVPQGGSDQDTFFTDEEIEELLSRKTVMYAAAAEGWAIKAGTYVGLVDIDESGSERSLSDLHAHALKQAKWFAEIGGVEDPSSSGAVTTKVVGKVASLRERESPFLYDVIYSRRGY